METEADTYKREKGWYQKDIKEALESIPKEDMCLGCWTYPVDGRCGCKFGGKNVDTKRS